MGINKMTVDKLTALNIQVDEIAMQGMTKSCNGGLYFVVMMLMLMPIGWLRNIMDVWNKQCRTNLTTWG